MGFKFSQRSENNLVGVHPDMVKLVRRALELSTKDFTITEGLRTVERQKQLLSEGKSKTMNSRHIQGMAVDVYPGSWDWKDFYPVADAFKAASKELGIPVTWGGDWKTFKDAPHFELPHAQYPNAK